jgi:NADH dehydrogenase
MRIAITGGTGFVGGHLARRLVELGHDVVLVARGVDRHGERILDLPRVTYVPVGVSDRKKLATAFGGCDAVAHCAGINRELGAQSFERVHVEGTRSVVAAAKLFGVQKILLVSFLRSRPGCGSPYHESKWAAEELVRASGLDFTVFKPGVIYGKGDHMLDHLTRGLGTFPVFLTVGMRDRAMRPLAVEDLVRVMVAALVDGRLSRATVAVTGPEEITVSEAVRRVAQATGRRARIMPAPVWVHSALAWCFEKLMAVPLASRAQVRILAEGLVQALPPCASLPEDLQPRTRFSQEQIIKGLPAERAFSLHDLRLCAREKSV